MSELILHHAPAPGSDSQAIVLPEPRVAVTVRAAVKDDLPFIDALQKKHSRAVGWMPRSWMEANVEEGNILLAETIGTATLRVANHDAERRGTPVGYIIGKDRYMKHDDLGILYQVNVIPEMQRQLVGATLLKSLFDRAAYGCRLFCGWCAQDLEANKFWEAMGFIPLAFRTGSRVARLSEPGVKTSGSESRGTRREPRPRIHIFWQRRIREGDTETPYWFPSETSGGAVRENRLVLPIPPGTHWSDAKPAVLPGLPGMENVNMLPAGSEDEKKPRPRKNAKKKDKAAPPAIKPKRPSGGLWFAPPKPPPPTPEEIAKAKEEKKKAREKFKNDPKLVAAARELRDRYMEQIHSAPGMLPPSASGKYDVSRQLEAAPSAMKIEQVNLLEAA